MDSWRVDKRPRQIPIKTTTSPSFPKIFSMDAPSRIIKQLNQQINSNTSTSTFDFDASSNTYEWQRHKSWSGERPWIIAELVDTDGQSTLEINSCYAMAASKQPNFTTDRIDFGEHQQTTSTVSRRTTDVNKTITDASNVRLETAGERGHGR